MIENLKKYTTLDLENTDFIGYEALSSKSSVIGLFNSECEIVKTINEIGYIIFDKTPFYAMAGGQDSDKGIIILNNGNQIELINVRKDIVHGFYIHEVKLDGAIINIGDVLELKVDSDYRRKSSISHSALHIVGQEIINLVNHTEDQLGSKVNNEKYQIQFALDDKITEKLIAQAIDNVNKNVLPLNIESNIYLLSKQETMDKGYDFDFSKLNDNDTVRIVEFPTYTSEPCGGTHVKNTNEIGKIWFTNFDQNSKRILVEMSSNIDYVNTLFEDKLISVYNQIESNIAKGVKLGFDLTTVAQELNQAKELIAVFNYTSIKEINVIYKNITGVVNKFIKSKEADLLQDFINEELTFETIGNFKLYTFNNDMYSNKILTSKGIKLSNQNLEHVLVFANKYENGSNALLIRNKEIKFDLKEFNQTMILPNTSFRGGGTDSMIQLVSQDNNDFQSLIELIKKTCN